MDKEQIRMNYEKAVEDYTRAIDDFRKNKILF